MSKLQEGSYYRLNNGNVVGPCKKIKGSYLYTLNGSLYESNGNCYYGSDKRSWVGSRDVVEEVEVTTRKTNETSKAKVKS